MIVRWLPVEANGEVAARAVLDLPAHPSLPKVHQTGKTGAAAFVAMEFPDGRLLATVLDERLPPQELRRVGADIAGALAELHSQGICHGELSADSVLLLSDQRAILWDVPLVVVNRLTDRRGEERAIGQLVRMAPFLPPERARGGAASTAADVYALAAVLCLAGGGRQPPSTSTLGTVYQLASGQWTPSVPESAPGDFQALLRQMLNADPALRPTARQVADALAGPPGSIVRLMPILEAQTEPFHQSDLPFVSGLTDLSAVTDLTAAPRSVQGWFRVGGVAVLALVAAALFTGLGFYLGGELRGRQVRDGLASGPRADVSDLLAPLPGRVEAESGPALAPPEVAPLEGASAPPAKPKAATAVGKPAPPR